MKILLPLATFIKLIWIFEFDEVEAITMPSAIFTDLGRSHREKRDLGSEPESPTILRPTDVVPSHYNVTIFPDIYHENPSDFKIWGSMSCDFTVARETTTVLLHANNQTIENWEAWDRETGRSLRVNHGEATDTDVIFHIENLLPSRRYRLTFRFEHRLSGGGKGLFITRQGTSTSGAE